MAVVVTTPYSDYRFGSKGAQIVKEVSGALKAAAALGACGLNRNSDHPDDQNYVCDNYDVQQVSIDFWRITFAFSPKDSADQNNPLATPTTISWGAGLSSEPIDRDKDKNPIVNACGDPFDPPTQGDFVELFFNVTRWEPTPFDAQKAVKFMGAVNEGELTIMGNKFLDGQVKCERIAPEGDYTLSARAVPVRYEFRARQEGYDTRQLNQGLRCYFTQGRGNPQIMELFTAVTDANSGTVIKGDQISAPIQLDDKGIPVNSTFYVNKFGSFPVAAPSQPAGAKFEKSGDGKSWFVIYKKARRENLNSLGL